MFSKAIGIEFIFTLQTKLEYRWFCAKYDYFSANDASILTFFSGGLLQHMK